MTLAVCWSEQFAIHDSGRAGLYLPVGGLIEDDVHVDSTARIPEPGTCSGRAGLTIRRRSSSPGKPASRKSCASTRRSTSSGCGRCRSPAGGTLAEATPRWTSSSNSAPERGPAVTALDTVVSGGHPAHALLRRSGTGAWRGSGYGSASSTTAPSLLDRLGTSSASTGRRRGHRPHHGNGTDAIFYDEPSVLMVSLHRSRASGRDRRR